MKTRLFLSLTIGALLAGCAAFQTAAPFAVPAATCLILKKEPGAQGYLASASMALRKFSTAENLDAEGLRDALVSVPIDGVPPYAASGIYAVVTVAYQSLVEKYATDPEREEKLRSAIVALSEGISGGISQCGTGTRSRAAPKITKSSLQELADSIAGDLKRHR